MAGYVNASLDRNRNAVQLAKRLSMDKGPLGFSSLVEHQFRLPVDKSVEFRIQLLNALEVRANNFQRRDGFGSDLRCNSIGRRQGRQEDPKKSNPLCTRAGP